MTNEERKHMLSTQFDLLRHPKVMDKFYKTGKLPNISILYDPVKAKKLLKKLREKPDPFIEKAKCILRGE